MKLGSNEVHALLFAMKYPGWHEFAKKERSTREAVFSLYRKGFVSVREGDRYAQFKLRSAKNLPNPYMVK